VVRRRLTSIARLGKQGGRPIWSDEIRLATGLHPGASEGVAEWLSSGLLPWGPHIGTRVGSVIPGGFEAYARVFHPAEGAGGLSVTWREVADWSRRTVHPEMQWEAIVDPVKPTSGGQPWQQAPPSGRVSLEIRRRLVELLRNETTSGDLCWILVWVGWGFEPDVTFPDVPRVQLPSREYVLFHAPLEMLAEGLILGPSGHELAVPNMWWPEDRSWCVATEIDFRWTYVAGSKRCISQIVSDGALEALETDLEHRGDYKSDVVNTSRS
jgi:hypothetical protein